VGIKWIRLGRKWCRLGERRWCRFWGRRWCIGGVGFGKGFGEEGGEEGGVGFGVEGGVGFGEECGIGFGEDGISFGKEGSVDFGKGFGEVIGVISIGLEERVCIRSVKVSKLFTVLCIADVEETDAEGLPVGVCRIFCCFCFFYLLCLPFEFVVVVLDSKEVGISLLKSCIENLWISVLFLY
jgi:hypothetical protein